MSRKTFWQSAVSQKSYRCVAFPVNSFSEFGSTRGWMHWLHRPDFFRRPACSIRCAARFARSTTVGRPRAVYRGQRLQGPGSIYGKSGFTINSSLAPFTPFFYPFYPPFTLCFLFRLGLTSCPRRTAAGLEVESAPPAFEPERQAAGLRAAPLAAVKQHH